MAFPREAAVITPVSIADISVQLFDPTPNSGEAAGTTYSVQVRFSDGTMQVRTGNLTPHLTQVQINILLAFMASMRAKAIAEILA